MTNLDPLADLIKHQDKLQAMPPIPEMPTQPETLEIPTSEPAPVEPIAVADVEEQSFDFSTVKDKLKRSKMGDLTVDVRSLKPLKGVIPTGHAAFDLASGIGGIGCGIITEMYGPESVGKSTIALMVCARAQALGKAVLWIDQEHSFDPVYARSFGMELNDERKLWLTAPDNIEDAFTIAGTALDMGFRGVIVYDSLGAGLPKQVMEENAMGEMRIGLKSSILGICIQQLEPQINKNKAAVIFINQLRANIRIPTPGQQRVENADYGEESSVTTPGGWVLKHTASVRIQMRKLHTRLWEEREKKSEIEVKFVKNKLAAAYGIAKMTLKFGSGFLPV